MSPAHHVVDVDTASFDRVVVEESQRRPVLVDFWAQWCGPCRTLTPVLEKVVAEYGGNLLLAKVDTDTERELATRFAIRSLPTVKLFVEGAVVDEFLGAQPESAVRAMLEAHVPRESDAVRSRALAARSRGEVAQARELLEQALACDPANPRLLPSLAECLIDLGELDAAERLLEELPAKARLGEPWPRIAARLRFARIAQAAPDEDCLLARVQSSPDDCEARFRLAAVRVGRGDHEGAMELLLDVLRLDRSFGEDAARTAMLDVFALLAPGDPLIARYRARMSSLLY